jgi:steroid 5-alpha reductase family enzyme
VIIWLGAAIFAIPTLYNLKFLSLVSPIFEFLLIYFVSGVPILEKKADKKWGTDPEYIEYKRNTPVFFPFGRGDEVDPMQAGLEE